MPFFPILFPGHVAFDSTSRCRGPALHNFDRSTEELFECSRFNFGLLVDGNHHVLNSWPVGHFDAVAVPRKTLEPRSIAERLELEFLDELLLLEGPAG